LESLVKFPNKEKQEKRESRLVVAGLTIAFIAHFVMTYFGW